jgi:hypothetical protein
MYVHYPAGVVDVGAIDEPCYGCMNNVVQEKTFDRQATNYIEYVLQNLDWFFKRIDVLSEDDASEEGVQARLGPILDAKGTLVSRHGQKKMDRWLGKGKHAPNK